MINAVFKMVGTNPSSILIVLGGLFMFVGFVGASMQIAPVENMIWAGLGFIALGVVLHITWLRR